MNKIKAFAASLLTILLGVFFFAPSVFASAKNPATGETIKLILLIAGVAAAIILIVVLLIKKKKSNE